MSLTSATVSALVLVAVYTLHRSRRPSHPYPPGPKGKPLIGNVGDIPKDYRWLAFSKLGKEYGPLVHLNMMGQSVIVINDHKIAIDLLESRSSIYSERYYSIFTMELSGFETFPVLQSYTPRLRSQRRLMHSALASATVQRDIWPLQQEETRIFLKNLLEQPDAFLDYLLHLAGDTILKMTYGATKDGELDFAKMSLDMGTAISDASNGYLVDIIPILKYLPNWMPGAAFKKKAAEWKRIALRNYNVPFEMVKRMRATDEAPPSYCTRLLDENEANGGGQEGESIVRETAAMMYSGAVNTTSSVIHVFFLVMLLYPEIQRLAQEEVDKVIGRDRLPSLQDRADLPYVEAVYLECLRWYPVAPASIPHCLKQNDVYNGYHLPAGSIIYTNLWGISRDEKNYQHPDEFNPSRWLNDNSKPLDPRSYVFGYGRRICPGMHVAQASVWIAMASILSTFNIKKRKDFLGEDITPAIEFQTGIVSRPRPFVCDFVPRSEKAVSLIRESVTDTSEL